MKRRTAAFAVFFGITALAIGFPPDRRKHAPFRLSPGESPRIYAAAVAGGGSSVYDPNARRCKCPPHPDGVPNIIPPDAKWQGPHLRESKKPKAQQRPS